MWMCSQTFAWKKINVKIQGLHHLKNKVSQRLLGMEGRIGWVLLEPAVDPSVQKLRVSNVGVNWTSHLIYWSCIRPWREDNDGNCISIMSQRVIVIGPDIYLSTDKLG
jgi:hypothetical protein